MHPGRTEVCSLFMFIVLCTVLDISELMCTVIILSTLLLKFGGWLMEFHICDFSNCALWRHWYTVDICDVVWQLCKHCNYTFACICHRFVTSDKTDSLLITLLKVFDILVLGTNLILVGFSVVITWLHNYPKNSKHDTLYIL